MTTVKNVIKRQIDSSGILLLNASKILTDDEFKEEHDGGVSMAWVLGHLTALQDWAVHRVFLEEEPKLNRTIREAFKGGRKIVDSDREHIGTKEEMEQQFAESQYITIRTLESFDDSLWDKETPSACRFPTLGSLWEHLGVHNYWHLGQVGSVIPKLVGSNLTLSVPRYYTVDPIDS